MVRTRARSSATSSSRESFAAAVGVDRAAALGEASLEALEVGARDLAVEILLRAEVVVRGREVRAGAIRDLAHRGAAIAALGEDRPGGVDQPVAGLAAGRLRGCGSGPVRHETDVSIICSRRKPGGRAHWMRKTWPLPRLTR